MLIDVTATRKLRQGQPPVTGIGVPRGNIPWDAAPREEPHADGVAGPFRGVDAAVGGVEAISIGLGVGGGDAAARVVGGVDVAVGAQDGAAGYAVVRNGAARVGVERHLVGGGAVDVFDYVDFTGGGPVGAEEPAGGRLVKFEGGGGRWERTRRARCRRCRRACVRDREL